jgi:hypothetical protein
MKRSVGFALLFLTVSMVGIIPSGFGQQPASTSVQGGPGGSPFADPEIPSGARVAEVYVFSGNEVDAVQMLYVLPNGRTMMGPHHGGPGGRQNVFRLDNNEYIVGLTGRCGAYVDSLQIQTNRRSSPIFGGPGGSRNYRIDVAPGSQAIGFVGRSGAYLDAVGLAFIPLRMRTERREESGQSGIAGGDGGSAFSEQNIPPGARISEIRVRSGEMVDSIQAVYILENGRVFEGPRYGGNGGNLSIFRLDRDEFIVGISGRRGKYVDSLSIQTNRRTSQAFGGGGGDRNYHFSAPPGQMVIGFVGRAGEYLDAIGLNYTAIDQRRRDNRTPDRR